MPSLEAPMEDRNTPQGGSPGQTFRMRDANWHLFSCIGLRFLLDVRTGTLHELDEVAWEILNLWGTMDPASITERLVTRYGREEVEGALGEVEELFASGYLTPWDAPEEVWIPPEDHVIKALCLNVAHDCNMRCRYCFAGTGNFGGERGLMSLAVALRSIDFLLENMGPVHNCEVDFFGGEPLLNPGVVMETVRYGKEEAKRRGKQVHFTLTTNATLLDEAMSRFLAENGISVILSLDGRKEVNDAIRQFPGGSGSYDRILQGIRKWLDTGSRDYYVRGTYTRANLDFCQDVIHLVELGFRRISLEPVVGGPDEDFSIGPRDIPRIKEEYERLACYFVEKAQEGDPFSFFHFNVDLAGGPCLKRRVLGCGAGNEYLAISPAGDIYPCHQLVGRPEYRMGDVFRGILSDKIRSDFRRANIYAKEGCSSCWARFYCSGGCHASALAYSGSLLRPDPVACEIQKKRIECALAVKTLLSISGQ